MKLVFHSSTITMTHGPINIRLWEALVSSCNLPVVFVRF